MVNQQIKQVTRDRVRIQIPSNPRYIAHARSSIYNLAIIHGFNRIDALDLKIITGEAINNIITHAYSKKFDQSIFLEILMFENHIEIKFQDFGKQIPVTKADIRDLSDYRLKGLGVYLISKLADYHYYDQSGATGTILTIKKRRNP